MTEREASRANPRNPRLSRLTSCILVPSCLRVRPSHLSSGDFPLQSKKTVLITGATDGIGRALAKIYRTRGDRLVLVGRRTLDTLNDALYTKDTYCRADLSQDDCTNRVCAFLNAQKIDAINLVIQNAGTGYYGTIAEQSAESIREIVAVNLMAPLRLTHALMPHLKKTNGKLVLIGSITHAFPCPDYAVYAASQRSPQHPGTQFANRGRRKCTDHSPGSDAHGLASKIGLNNEKTKGFPSAEKVAQKITQAIDGRRFIATIGWRNAWARFLGRYCEGIVNAIVRAT